MKKNIKSGELIKDFWSRNDDIKVQFLRYAVVGGIAFAVDYSMLFVLTEFFSIHYLISAAVSFSAGLAVNYTLAVKWVFQTSLKNKSLEISVYALIGIIGLGLNEAAIWFFTEVTDMHYMISKIVAAILVLIWNFIARRKLMMKGK